MDNRLKLVFVLFFVFLLGFIFIVLVSEYRNMQKLRVQYPDLPEAAYDLRKDRLKVWAISLILKFLIPVLFLTSRLSYRIRFFVERDRSIFLTGLFYGLIYFTIMFLISLPLDYYGSFILGHKYGLSNQTFARWLEVNIKSFLVNNLPFSLFIFIPFCLIYRSPRFWWLQISLLIIPVIIFIVFISPFFIDPIFNKYTSIEDEKLGQEIKVLLNKAGIEDARIFKVDKSRDTKTMNAYMTGIFHSKRIVLWDTTINNLEEREILCITAHEIGHYVRGHIWKNIILSSIGTIILSFLVYATSNWILNLSNGSFGFKKLYDIAALPLILLVLNFYLFLSLPIQNFVSRYMEVEADKYEILLTEDREASISAMEKLYDQSLGLPRPSKIYKIWYNTHPTLEERIEFYKTYPLD